MAESIVKGYNSKEFQLHASVAKKSPGEDAFDLWDSETNLKAK